MTKDETMEMALEALEEHGHPIYRHEKPYDDAMKALRQALEQPKHQPWCASLNTLLMSHPPQPAKCNCGQPEQEPVAWVKTLSEPQPHCVTDLKYMSFADAKASVQYIPLYAAPPKQEFVCSTGLCHYKHWVGLTEEEIFDLADHYGEFKYGDAQGHKRIGFARAIEAKLKGKNRVDL